MQSGNKRRWSAPTTIRQRCGTISPTKPTGPATATAAPVNNRTKSVEQSFTRPDRIPRFVATSSPRLRIVICGASNHSPSSPKTVHGKTATTCSQETFVTPPIVQYSIVLAIAYTITKAWVIAEKNAETTIPASARRAGERPPGTAMATASTQP